MDKELEIVLKLVLDGKDHLLTDAQIKLFDEHQEQTLGLISDTDKLIEKLKKEI